MGEIVKILFGRFIIRFLGLYTRYYFFYLTGKKKTIKYLSGDIKRLETSLSQDFYNAVVGGVSFGIISFGIAYLVWGKQNYQ